MRRFANSTFTALCLIGGGVGAAGAAGLLVRWWSGTTYDGSLGLCVGFGVAAVATILVSMGLYVLFFQVLGPNLRLGPRRLIHGLGVAVLGLGAACFVILALSSATYAFHWWHGGPR